MINLLHISEGRRWAGIETHIFLLLREIKNHRDIRKISLASLFDGALRKKVGEMGVQTCLINRKSIFSLQPIFQLRDYIEHHSIQIVHTHGYLATIYGLISLFFVKRKVPSVITFHQRAATHPSMKMNLYVRIMFMIAKLSGSHFICVSNDVKESAVRKFNIPEQRTTIIHNGIQCGDNAGFARDKKSFGFDPNRKTIGIVGRLVPVKRHDFFIQLASELVKERDDVEFVIIGDGPGEEELKQRIRKEEMEGRIKMTGFVDDILSCINCLDILTITSEHEGIPYVLLEALMLKKPVVATRVGGIPEVITSGFNGMLSDRDDMDEMKKNIIELLENPDMVADLGKNGHATIRWHFSACTMADRTVTLYNRLLTGEGVSDA